MEVPVRDEILAEGPRAELGRVSNCVIQNETFSALDADSLSLSMESTDSKEFDFSRLRQNTCIE